MQNNIKSNLLNLKPKSCRKITHLRKAVIYRQFVRIYYRIEIWNMHFEAEISIQIHAL